MPSHLEAPFRALLGRISERIVDADVRSRWLAAPLHRELAAAVSSVGPSGLGLMEPASPPAKAAPRKRLAGGLTEREADVLRLVASGKTNREIAADLALVGPGTYGFP